jgi:transposase
MLALILSNSITMQLSFLRTAPYLLSRLNFTNDSNGFHRLSYEFSDYAPEPVIIDFESTAHYGDNLARYLVANDYKVCVINLIQTSSK